MGLSSTFPDLLISRELQTEVTDVFIPNEFSREVGFDSGCEPADGVLRGRWVMWGKDSSEVGGTLRD
jgi:hypothetical protein